MSEPIQFSEAQRIAFEAFRKEYAARLPARIAAVEKGWNAVCKERSIVETLNEVVSNIHNLRGSAATCGFPEVSERAAALESIVSSVLRAAGVPTAEERAEFARHLDELRRAQSGDVRRS